MTFDFAGTKEDLAYLRTTSAVRERCRVIRARSDRGEGHLAVDAERIDRVVDYVAEVIRQDPTASELPTHGRMRHFDAGGRLRSVQLARMLGHLPREEQARALIDLVVPSVILDAGAGPAWAFTEDGLRLERSEGLAVASLHLFLSGAMSGDRRSVRADADGLSLLDVPRLGEALQVSPDNPIVGLEGRALLMSRLADALRAAPRLFGDDARPGGLFDTVAARARDGEVRAEEVLALVLEGLSSIWPDRPTVAGEQLGDAWPHPALGDGIESLVPFHKLSQWLVHSLVEPLGAGGILVTDLDELTGLAEYRNGGLLLDLGAIEVLDPGATTKRYQPRDPFVVEWRALTVELLDVISPMVCQKVGIDRKNPRSAGLVAHGTWAAGRKIARSLRPHGGGPLEIESDGTVF